MIKIIRNEKSSQHCRLCKQVCQTCHLSLVSINAVYKLTDYHECCLVVVMRLCCGASMPLCLWRLCCCHKPNSFICFCNLFYSSRYQQILFLLLLALVACLYVCVHMCNWICLLDRCVWSPYKS